MAGSPPQSRVVPLADEEAPAGTSARPPELVRLLGARSSVESERAWDRFLSTFGHLLLRTAKYTHRDHDGAMDAYTHVLERLRQQEFRRLRMFSGGDADAFCRWLVVVTRRLCLDFRRARYGRPREATRELERDTRRRLIEELWSHRDPSDLPGPRSASPEWQLRRTEQRDAVETVVSELAPRDQLLLSLRFDEELSARRIAEFLGWPTPFHVYRRLHKVLASLRARLRALGIDDPNP